MYLTLDENNYLLSIASVGGGLEVDIDLTAYDLSGDRINAHKWENDTLIFDEERYNEIIKEKEEAKTLTNSSGDNGVVTWGEIDAAYNEGRDSAYEQ